MLYLLFETPNSPVQLQQIDQASIQNNAYLQTAYFLEPAPDFLNEQNAHEYDISLSPEKELIIAKKPITLSLIKEQKAKECIQYGNSKEVDACNIGGTDIVLNALTRYKIYERLKVIKAKGLTEDTIILGDKIITLNINIIEHIIDSIVFRAVENFNVLQEHLRNIQALNTETEINEYDFTTHYKPKLSFNL